MNLKWKQDDTDDGCIFDRNAFLIETKEADYYYALKSALSGKGDHYYKIYNDKSLKMEEIDPSEIVDIIQNHPDRIIVKCPCIKIIDGKIQPLFSKR